MAKITYPQQLPEDANSIKHVSIGQTRDGKDEWITPVTMWERNKSSGLYLPPGVLSDDDVAIPRVKAQLYGTIVGIEVTRPNSIILEPGQKIYEPVVDFRDEMFALSYSLRHVAGGSVYAKPVLKWSCAIQNNFHEYDTVQELEHEELIGFESTVTKTTKKIFPVGRYGRLMIENKDNTKNVVIYRVTCTKYRA